MGVEEAVRGGRVCPLAHEAFVSRL
jgi:hypothetical protein